MNRLLTIIILVSVIVLLYCSSYVYSKEIQHIKVDDVSSSPSTLPTQWNVIGPFPIGEREEGLDSLGAYGGIFKIPIGDKSLYPSELGNGGKVGWTLINSAQPGSVSLDWSNVINWSFLQQVWGWHIWLWYGYAVGTFTVNQSGQYIVQCSGTRSYFIQDTSAGGYAQEFVGDMYGYGVGQQLVQLEQSTEYQFIVRMTSSVRMNQSPLGQFNCQLEYVNSEVDSAIVLSGESLISDVVSGQLASPYLTVTILNVADTILSDLSVQLAFNDTSIDVEYQIISNISLNTGLPSLQVLPGQKLSLPIQLSSITEPLVCPLQLEINILSNSNVIANTTLVMNCTVFQPNNPYLFTFIDFDSSIQYAIAMPPLTPGAGSAGVMLAIHGAGVEASSSFWMDAIPQQQDMWILYPTGRRSWGFDWSSASRLNILHALNSLARDLPGLTASQKQIYSVDPQKLLVVGHSMGGHGCALFLSHFGDLAIGGACASGFVRLDFYVFMNSKPGYSYIDPVLQGLLQASIAENDNDLYSSNLVGIPLMVRYGENDTNVNPWHSRRIARMVCEQSSNQSAVIVSEVPNQGHWFDGILGDGYMQDYYNSLTSGGQSGGVIPPIPNTITVTTNNPASSGSRANIQILQLQIPYRVGRIQLTQQWNSQTNTMTWVLITQNIRRFALVPEPVREVMPSDVLVDGQPFSAEFYPEYHYTSPDNKYGNIWNVSNDQSWLEIERTPSTYGPMRQIFEKPFVIVYGTNVSSDTLQLFQSTAIKISNTWNTYGRGTPQIIADTDIIDTNCNENTNYIMLGSVFENYLLNKYQSQLPVQYTDEPSPSFSIGPVTYSIEGQGIAYLSPNQCNQGLFLVVSGNGDQGFINAARSIPQRSGVVAPDFMVIGNEWWMGAGGILATGYFDNTWQVDTDTSYFTLNKL